MTRRYRLRWVPTREEIVASRPKTILNNWGEWSGLTALAIWLLVAIAMFMIGLALTVAIVNLFDGAHPPVVFWIAIFVLVAFAYGAARFTRDYWLRRTRDQ
jgi:hypothetical protein